MDLILEIQQTIYAHGKKTKSNISTDELKKVGADTLSQEMFGFIQKLKNIIAYLDPIPEVVKKHNAEFNQLKTENDKLKEYSQIYSKMEEGFQDWKMEVRTEFDKKGGTDSALDAENIQKAISEEVQKTLPSVLKSVVKEVTAEKKFSKTWADIVQGAQTDIKEEFGKTFKTTLESALQENQGDILEKTLMKQEADQFEKSRRCRNIVITMVPESTKTEIPDKVADDTHFITQVIGIPEPKIVKCYRSGPPLGQGSNRDRTDPRPLVVTLESPQLALHYHKYGNGNRIITKDNGECWINQDFTRAERHANYLARKARRNRSSGGDAEGARSGNEDTVAAV